MACASPQDMTRSAICGESPKVIPATSAQVREQRTFANGSISTLHAPQAPTPAAYFGGAEKVVDELSYLRSENVVG